MCSCGETYVSDYVPALTHNFSDNSCQNCGQLDDSITYIDLSSAEDIYALSRILASDKMKSNIYGTSYDINHDLQRFVYPSNVTDISSKIEYLSTAAYQLTSDIELTMQHKYDELCFLGIGSGQYPFQGIFNGNEKTVTLNTNGKIALDSVAEHEIGLFGNIQKAKIVNTNVCIEDDVLVSSCTKPVRLGALVGYSNESQISNCNVSISNSNVGVSFSKGESNIHKAHVGGIVGASKLSIVRYTTVNLTDATLCAQGFDVSKYESMYAFFSVGGIMGFSEPGSDNVAHIGRIGNQLVGCKMISENEMQRNVIFASLEKGDEVTAGGIVGCTFNNFIAKNCTVEVVKGNIVAQKTGATDDATFGTNAGGIIGRLEHTGSLNNCSVNGDYLNIISESPENYSTAGGIVGYDVACYHRDVVSLDGCSFNGNGTSKIILNIKADPAINKWNAMGGIAGGSSYQIKDCSVKDVTLVNQSANVDKIFVGGICGILNNSNFWKSGTYFIPSGEPGLNDCTFEGIKYDVVKNAIVQKLIGFQQS